MRKLGFFGLLTILFVLLLASGCGSNNTETKSVEKPKVPEHKSVSHVDKVKEYKGPETCLQCHPKAMDQVLGSVHFTMKTSVKHVDGVTAQEGMATRYCSLPGSIVKINWLGKVGENKQEDSGCGRCHIGSLNSLAQLSAPIDDKVKSGIDCLVCHASKYDFKKRVVVPDGENKFKVEQDRSLEAAQSVGSTPKPENCASCHDKNGGGYLFKRGVDYSKSDIHAQKGVYCVDCHTTNEHKIAAGKVSDLWANDSPDTDVSCGKCHTEKPHSNDKLNQHAEKIYCTTCHVTHTGGAQSKDFTAPKQKANGVFEPTTVSTDKTDVKPIYLWFNGTANKEVKPNGSKGDAKSKIYPFRQYKGTVPVDAATKKPLFLKLGVYFTKGNLEAAIKKGLEDSKQEYSGKWEPGTEVATYQVTHGVVPKEQALKCSDCHSKKSVLDFKALGYGDNEIKDLQESRD